MKDKETVVMYDFDSTIAHTYWRGHLTPRNNPGSTWDDYAMACSDDTPLPGTVMSMRLHWPHHYIDIATSRPERSRALGEAWLDKHTYGCWDHLTLKPDHIDISSLAANADVKIARILHHQSAGRDVLLFHEDIAEVAARIYDSTGVPVLGVNPFYPPAKVGAS